jgi:hypothetical protein
VLKIDLKFNFRYRFSQNFNLKHKSSSFIKKLYYTIPFLKKTKTKEKVYSLIASYSVTLALDFDFILGTLTLAISANATRQVIILQPKQYLREVSYEIIANSILLISPSIF